jgi:hypothetical protein
MRKYLRHLWVYAIGYLAIAFAGHTYALSAHNGISHGFLVPAFPHPQTHYHPQPSTVYTFPQALFFPNAVTATQPASFLQNIWMEGLPKVGEWASISTTPLLPSQEIFAAISLPILQTLASWFHFNEYPIFNKKQVEKAKILASKEYIPGHLDVVKFLHRVLSAWLECYRQQRSRWDSNTISLSEVFQQTLWNACPSADRRAFVPLEEWYIRLHTIQQACLDYMTTALHYVPFDSLTNTRKGQHSLTTGGKYHQISRSIDASGKEWILKPFHFQ